MMACLGGHAGTLRIQGANTNIVQHRGDSSAVAANIPEATICQVRDLRNRTDLHTGDGPAQTALP